MEENRDELYLDVDGDALDIEHFEDCSDATDGEPTREEYESLMGGIFKSFYESDMQRIKEDAQRDAKKVADEQREALIKEAQRELLCKIRAKNQRISEVGAMKTNGNVKRRVSDMTKEERALVAKRAASGEIINLK